VPEAPESWGTIPIDDLMAKVEDTTNRLSTQYKEVALDQGAYHRKFWKTWQELPEGLSIAAMNRECEMACAQLNEEVLLKRSLLESLLAKRDALVAILSARAK
jgi:hypothetical protein